jgi:hypothetical protein
LLQLAHDNRFSSHCSQSFRKNCKAKRLQKQPQQVVSIAGMSVPSALPGGQHCKNVRLQVVKIVGMILIRSPPGGQYGENPTQDPLVSMLRTDGQHPEKGWSRCVGIYTQGKLARHYRELQIKDRPLPAVAVKTAFLGIEKEKTTYFLLWLVGQHHSMMQKVLKPGTMKNCAIVIPSAGSSPDW